MTDLAYNPTLDPGEEPGRLPPALVALVGAFIVPILAATGLSLPLPSIVYRVAVDIATLAESLVAGVTGHDLGREGENRAPTDRIVLTVREQRAQSANRIVIVRTEPEPGIALASKRSNRVGRGHPTAPRTKVARTTATSPEPPTLRLGAAASPSPAPTVTTSVAATTSPPATEPTRTQPTPKPTTDPVPTPNPDPPIVVDTKAPLTNVVRAVTTDPVGTVTTIVAPVVSDPVGTVTTIVTPVVEDPVGAVTQAAPARDPLTTVIPKLPTLPTLP